MGEKEDRERLDREILERLTRVEAKQDLQLQQSARLENHAIAIAKLEASAKSAHHRQDAMQLANAELKKELSTAIKEQAAGIYRTASIISGVISFFSAVIMWIVK